MNSLGKNLTDKVVVFPAAQFKPEYQDLRFRLWLVTGGFGAVPFTMGTALICRCLADGEEGRMSSMDVERLATPDEIAEYATVPITHTNA